MFVELFKEVANGCINVADMSDIITGKVVSIKPMKIAVEGLGELDKGDLIVPESLVKDTFEFDVLDYATFNCKYNSTKHEMPSTIKLKLKEEHLPLKAGDVAVLVKAKGGQMYLVIGKVAKIT